MKQGADISKADLSKVEGFIWDLDNTLYRFDDGFEKLCDEAAARVALDLGLELSFEEAYATAVKSYKLYHYSYHIFVTEHGLPLKEFHTQFHEAIDVDDIARPYDIAASLEALDRPQIIATNGSRDWAERVLLHLGLSHLFPMSHVFGFEDYDHISKANTDKPYDIALETLQRKPENILVIEDSILNLIRPKTLGFQTALVHQDDIAEDHAHAVDHSFEDTPGLLQSLCKEN